MLRGFVLESYLLFKSLVVIAWWQASIPPSSISLSCIMLSRILLELPLPLPISESGRDLDSPKSQIFTLRSLSIRIFAGLISRCITLALWRNLMAHIKLYISLDATYSVRFASFALLRSFFKSKSMHSITMKTPI